MTFTDNAVLSGKHLQSRDLAKISPQSLERAMSNGAYEDDRQSGRSLSICTRGNNL